MRCVRELPRGSPLEDAFVYSDVFVTVYFTIEYTARLTCTSKPLVYALSFFGILDGLVAIESVRFLIPKWGGIRGDEKENGNIDGMPQTVVVRLLRMVWIFRILK